MDAVLIGQVGNYSIVRQLGSGGMGEVYEAHDDRLDRRVAIKVLPPDAATDPERRRRAEREARMAASLDHPFICKVYEFVNLGDQAAIVMEYVDGSTLQEVLTAGHLEPCRVARMAHELAEALDLAHGCGLVHRDIKPSNVMITVHDHPKIMDFGIAKDVHHSGPDDTTTMTGPGLILGTPCYMSPEQAKGDPVDQRSDIFSFGIVIHQCLSGELPFEGSSRGTYLANLVDGCRKPFPGSVPGPFRDLIDRCLAPDPGARFATCSQVAAALEVISAQLQPVARQTKLRSTGALLIALAATAMLAVPLSVYWWPADEPRRGLDTVVSQGSIITWPTNEGGGSVSPSGRIVAFLSDRGEGRRIWLRSVEGRDPRAITSPHRLIRNIVWSPDESRVAYLFGDAGEVYLQVASIWGERVLSPVHLEYAFNDIRLLRWLGDLIYLLAEPTGASGAEVLQLDLASAPAPTLTLVASGLPIRSNNHEPEADISSDGKTLVYVETSNGYDGLWVADADGGHPRRLIHTQYRLFAPRWRGPDPDSSIVYISNDNGQFDIWEFDRRRGFSLPLTSSPLVEDALSVSADGETIVVDASQNDSNLWGLDLRPGAQPVQLTNDSRSDLWPSGTGHSNRFIFHRMPSGVSRGGFAPFETTLLLTDLEAIRSGASPATIIDGFAGRLSPSGEWVAFLRFVMEPSGHAEVWLYSLRTRGEALRIAEVFALPGLATRSMSWSSSNMVWSGASDLYYVAVGAGHNDEIRRVRPGPPNEIQPETVVRAPDPETRLGDLRPSPDGGRLGFVAWPDRRYPGGQLRVLDTARDRIETLASFPEGRMIGFLGWRADGGGVVLSTPPASLGGPTAELSVVSPNGTITPIATLPGADGFGAAYDARRDTIYLTQVDGPLRGVRAYRLANRQLVPIVDGSVPGISFGGFELVGEDTLLFFRKEDKADIWLLKLE